jgi:hypothetical protein
LVVHITPIEFIYTGTISRLSLRCLGSSAAGWGTLSKHKSKPLLQSRHIVEMAYKPPHSAWLIANLLVHASVSLHKPRDGWYINTAENMHLFAIVSSPSSWPSFSYVTLLSYRASGDPTTFNYQVTGASGFIGSHVVDELLRQGYSVRGYAYT